VGTFTLREALALRDLRTGALDPESAAGFVRLRQALLVLWALCLLIGLFGVGLAWASGSARAAWPYAAAAAILLVIHAPRRGLFAPAVPTRVEGS
jgi:hypothetical protein